MSAFGGKADMAYAWRDVCLWPKADLANGHDRKNILLELGRKAARKRWRKPKLVW